MIERPLMESATTVPEQTYPLHLVRRVLVGISK